MARQTVAQMIEDNRDTRSLCDECRAGLWEKANKHLRPASPEQYTSMKYCANGLHGLWPACPVHKRENLVVIKRGKRAGQAVCPTELDLPRRNRCYVTRTKM